MKDKSNKWMKKNAKMPKLLFTSAIVVTVFQALFSVLFALAVKELVNAAVSGNSIDLVLKYLVLSLLTVIIAYGLALYCKVIIAKCVVETEANLKQYIFKTLLGKKYAGVSVYKSGELLNRIDTDVKIAVNGYVNVPITAVAIASKIVFAINALLIYQPIFTLILGGIALLVALISILIKKPMKKLHKASREAESKTMAFLNEGVNNMLAVKVFSAEDKMTNQAKNIIDNSVKVIKKQRYTQATISTALGFCFTLFYIITIGYGAYGLYNGNIGMDFGTITAMLQLVSQLSAPIASVGAVFSQRFEASASIDRLVELDALEDENEVSQNNFEFNKLVGKNVVFSYGREKVIDGGNFIIDKGDKVLIRGVSGIGKSTLMKLLLGVYDNFEGDIEFETNNGKVKVSEQTRSMFCYVPQGNFLFSGSIKDNICFMNENSTKEEIDSAVEISAVKDFANELPDKLETIIGEKGIGLSEGQGQRVAIARAILSKRPIILLDEATSSLDEQTEENVLKNLYSKENNSTVIIISHRPCAKKYCNKIIEFENGIISMKTN